jgi:hypothetical protein
MKAQRLSWCRAAVLRGNTQLGAAARGRGRQVVNNIGDGVSDAPEEELRTALRLRDAAVDDVTPAPADVAATAPAAMWESPEDIHQNVRGDPIHGQYGSAVSLDDDAFLRRSRTYLSF